jgi:hypothetical protein
MGIKIVAKIEQEFNEEKHQWEAEVTPTLIQTFEGYFTCPEHGTLHEDDLTERQADDTSGRCPHCNAVVDHKEETQIALATTLYEAPSVCEVNSAVETNLLMLQRRCEEEGENLRQAEEDRRKEKEAEEERDAEELMDLCDEVARKEGLSEDRHGGLIHSKALELQRQRKEERRAEPEPDAG